MECFDRIRWPFKILRDGWILKLPRQPVILAVDSPRIFSSVPHKALSKLASPRYACPPRPCSRSSLTSPLFSAFHSRVFDFNVYSELLADRYTRVASTMASQFPRFFSQCIENLAVLRRVTFDELSNFYTRIRDWLEKYGDERKFRVLDYKPVEIRCGTRLGIGD